MELEKIKLTDIKEAEYNPRYISDSDKIKLKNSIETFGVVDPIIVNLKTNTIIGGHQRYNALLDLNMENNEFFDELNLLRLGDIGWIFPETELTVENEDYEKALNLALNKISGDWDTEKLDSVFNDLTESGFNTDLTGFTIEEMGFNTTVESDESEYEDELIDDFDEIDVDEFEGSHICPKCGFEWDD